MPDLDADGRRGGDAAAQESAKARRAARGTGRGQLVSSPDLAALASVLGGYTNAAEQCAGVPPGAGAEAANADDAARHQDPVLTLCIARELLEGPDGERGGCG